MKLNKFSVPYTDDKRMIFAREYLENNGFISVDSYEKADFILLPVPVKNYMLEQAGDKPVFYGMGNHKNGFDYMKNENYVLKNAVLTAEGAVSFIEENTDCSLFGSKILILGYGRIGKALHKILKAYSADITVCSRSKDSKTLAEFNGAKHIYFDELSIKNNADIIINTVPHPVLTKKELSAVGKDTLILDLASFPGGVDTLVAKSLGLKLLNGKAMPSKYTQKTAGYIIGEAVINIIEEEFA